MSHAKLKDIDIIPMPGQRLQVRLWGRVYMLELESPEYEARLLQLLPLLDGRHDLAALCRAVDFPEGEIASILSTLRNMSLTEEGDVQATPGAELGDYAERHAPVFRVFQRSRVKSPAECLRRMHAENVTLLGSGPLADELARVLPDFGVRQLARRAATDAAQAPARDLLLLALDDYDSRSSLEAVNALCVARRQRLVPVYCDDDLAYIGPSLSPDHTACLMCMELRAASNVDNTEARSAYRRFIEGRGRSYPPIPAHLTTLACFVAHELLRVVTGYELGRSYNAVLRLDLWAGELSRSRVLRFPNCRVCSARARRPRYDNHAYVNLLARV